jgi:hypothetical protein
MVVHQMQRYPDFFPAKVAVCFDLLKADFRLRKEIDKKANITVYFFYKKTPILI